MKKRLSKTTIIAVTSFFIGSALVACGPETTLWVHYKAVAPTEASRGNIECWIDQQDQVSLTLPKEGDIIEGDVLNYEKYSKQVELWIENELKVTANGSSFVIPLKQLPDIYYAKDADYSNAEFKVIKDVKLTENWTTIGTEELPFVGVFDGNNKTISDLTINNNEYYQGLFGIAEGATFKNIKLNNIKLETAGFAGGIVGFVNGGENLLIENCHVLSGINKADSFDDLGGIVGGIYQSTKNAIIKNCSNAAKIESSAKPGRVGGIIGIAGPEASLLLENCVNKGEIVSQNSAGMIGGTRGQAQGAVFTLKNCKNEGTAKVPYVGFFNSSANSEDYLKVIIENDINKETPISSLFSTWQSGGTEGGILTVEYNGDLYKYFLIPTYTYSVTQGKIVSLQKVNSVALPLNKEEVTNVSSEDWANFIAINPKAAIYEEDGTFKGVSPTTNCYAPNSYYIKGAQYGGLVNTWVKITTLK